MEINGLIAKVIFDKNPDREFYLEESFPLDWMYPYLEPHGLIIKINRQPLPELSEAIVQRDHEYWTHYLQPMIGDWLNYDTPAKEITAFAEKVCLKRDLRGFKGDRQFFQNDYDGPMFSKLRSSIAGIYAWRLEHAANDAEKAHMAREADFAFRQAVALCPYSPEAVFRYVNFLKSQNRISDAILVAETAAKFPPAPGLGADALRNLVKQLESSQPATPAVFAMRLVVDAPSDDAEAMNLVFIGSAGRTHQETLYVRKTVLLDQTAVKSAKVVRDNMGKPQIDFQLTNAGRKRLAEVTRELIHKRLALVIDGRLYMAPVIQSEINSGGGNIAHNFNGQEFSEQEAEALAKKLNDAAAK
jgi:hypothetical protein